jgi:hypothetical protein
MQPKLFRTAALPTDRVWTAKEQDENRFSKEVLEGCASAKVYLQEQHSFWAKASDLDSTKCNLIVAYLAEKFLNSIGRIGADRSRVSELKLKSQAALSKLAGLVLLVTRKT